jgi:hypothetical protein
MTLLIYFDLAEEASAPICIKLQNLRKKAHNYEIFGLSSTGFKGAEKSLRKFAGLRDFFGAGDTFLADNRCNALICSHLQGSERKAKKGEMTKINLDIASGAAILGLPFFIPPLRCALTPEASPNAEGVSFYISVDSR